MCWRYPQDIKVHCPPCLKQPSWPQPKVYFPKKGQIKQTPETKSGVDTPDPLIRANGGIKEQTPMCGCGQGWAAVKHSNRRWNIKHCFPKLLEPWQRTPTQALKVKTPTKGDYPMITNSHDHSRFGVSAHDMLLSYDTKINTYLVITTCAADPTHEQLLKPTTPANTSQCPSERCWKTIVLEIRRPQRQALTIDY